MKLRVKSLTTEENFSGRETTCLPHKAMCVLYIYIYTHTYIYTYTCLPRKRTGHNRTINFFRD